MALKPDPLCVWSPPDISGNVRESGSKTPSGRPTGEGSSRSDSARVIFWKPDGPVRVPYHNGVGSQKQIQICMHTSKICVYIYIYMYKSMYLYMCIYIYIHAFAFAYVHVCIVFFHWFLSPALRRPGKKRAVMCFLTVAIQVPSVSPWQKKRS